MAITTIKSKEYLRVEKDPPKLIIHTPTNLQVKMVGMDAEITWDELGKIVSIILTQSLTDGRIGDSNELVEINS